MSTYIRLSTILDIQTHEIDIRCIKMDYSIVAILKLVFNTTEIKVSLVVKVRFRVLEKLSGI